ncbi:MAG: hypothetical protein IPM45_14270 [Acidimicrobiales bacterium]|nr:hypothetical protein [Acidimicrobiales bacterium]
MPTRRLIALALVCGMAILLAGGVQLFLLAGQDDGSSTGSLLEPGTSAEVGDVTAGVVSAERSGDAVLLVVDVAVATGADEGVDDARAGWGLLRGDSGALVDRAEVTGGEARPCAGLAVAPGESVECVVAFAPPPGSGDAFVAIYGRGDDRASWSVTV